jgi:uncharacterized protein
MPNAILIYLHGFLSSPRSAKAQQLAQYIKTHKLPIDYRIPELLEEPHLALAAAEKALRQAQSENIMVGLIGSSMGGFYATVLAERYDARAVLINPSVYPHLRLQDYIRDVGSKMVNPYSGRCFTLGESDVDALMRMLPEKLENRENYWLLTQTGDEVLDYRDGTAYYTGCKQTIEEGGDHQFQGFERYLPEIINFLQGSD